MARMTTAQWGYITGDVSSFAYRPLYGKDDVVYRKDEVTQTAGQNAAFNNRPYKVLRIAINQNAAGAPLSQADAAIAGAVANQDPAPPWVYDIQEILAGQKISTATGPITQGVKENNLQTLATIKTTVGTQVGNWADPAA